MSHKAKNMVMYTRSQLPSRPFLRLFPMIVALLGVAFPLQAQVPADDCSVFSTANEYPVSLNCTPNTLNTTGFTTTFNPGGCLAGNNVDAWAYFTAITSQTEVEYTITGCQGFLCGLFVSAVVHVFEGSCGSPVAVGCELSGFGINGTATVTIPTNPGQSYYVRVQRLFSDQAVEGELCITAIANPPANDDCANAIPVGDGTFPFTTVDATGSFATSCAFNDTNGVWFAYTATCSQEATFSVCDDADFDSVISLFDACGGTELGCNDDYFGCANFTSRLTVPVTAGQTYLVRIAGFEGAAGSGNLTISCAPPPPPPPNDDCANAIPVGEGLHPFDLVNATGMLSTSCSLNDTNDVWFAYTAACSGVVEVSTCGNAFFDTALGVFDACGGNEIACNDDAPGCLFFTSTATFTALAGNTYWVRVAGFQGAEGNGAVGITCTEVTWYSQASGNTSDPIWSLAPVGPAGPATFLPGASIVVQSGHSVVQDQPTVDALNVTIAAGADLDLGAGGLMNVHGNWVQTGDLLPGTGTVRLQGADPQTLNGPATLRFFDLQLDNASGAVVNADSLFVTGTLQLDNGTFDASGSEVVLLSDASGTARLGPVGAGATYVGDLRLQRYIPAGGTNWRLLASAVGGATVQQWDDDFFTAGFPGSDYPPFYVPAGSGILWPSIRKYEETDPGPASDDGLVGVGNVTEALTIGRGYTAWCGDNLTSTTEFLIDVAGPPTIATTPLALPVSWTNTGNPGVDGLNLVGNPLASPIDLGALVLGADVDSTFWVFDPVTGNNVFWDTQLGLGTGSMNGTIQSSQGFWVKTDGPANTVTVDEGAKTLDPNGGSPFGGLLLQSTPIMRLGLHSQLNGFRDEALLHLGAGGPGNDGIDVAKFTFAHPDAPQLWSASQSGEALALNAWGAVTQAVTIPMHVKAGVSGQYTLEVMQLTQPLEGLCVELEDLGTGTTTSLQLGATHVFDLDAATPADPARFLLHLSPEPQGELTASSTAVLVGEPVSFASGVPPGVPVNWDFGDGNGSNDEVPTHAYTLPGSYPVTLTLGSAPCEVVLTEVIEVGISTGLDELGDETFAAWTDGDALRLRWSFPGRGAYEVKLFDPIGRELRTLRLAEASGQATLDLTGQPDGVYVLRLLSGDAQRTVRLPVVR